MSGFIYLASPYSHPEMSVRVDRFMAAQNFCVWAYDRKWAVFSPIVHWHHLACQYDLPFDAEHWQPQNDAMLAAAQCIYVLTIPGWKKSKGVAQEVRDAIALGKNIYHASIMSPGVYAVESK